MNEKDLQRIEEKLDKILDFFNIKQNQVPGRSRKELREQAIATVLKFQGGTNVRDKKRGRKVPN